MGLSKQYKRKGSYIRKWEEILASPAYRDLSPADRCLLEEFQRIYRPGRNGRLSISTRKAVELLNVSEPTAIKAFHALEDHGFLRLAKGHYWQERKAREWRFTFEPGSNNKEPTDEWRNWKPDKKSRLKNKGQICSKNRGSLLKNVGQSPEASYLAELKINDLR